MSKPVLAVSALLVCLVSVIAVASAIKGHHLTQARNGQIPSDNLVDRWAEKVPSWDRGPAVTNAFESIMASIEHDLSRYRIATMSSNRLFALEEKFRAANQIDDLFRIRLYEEFKKTKHDPDMDFAKLYQQLSIEEANAKGTRP